MALLQTEIFGYHDFEKVYVISSISNFFLVKLNANLSLFVTTKNQTTNKWQNL